MSGETIDELAGEVKITVSCGCVIDVEISGIPVPVKVIVLDDDVDEVGGDEFSWNPQDCLEPFERGGYERA